MDEGPVDHLFTLPLKEFVAARNALAKKLKSAGEKEAAARLKKLPKPSISAWALNQLVRKHPDLVQELLAEIDRQRALQLEGLSGSTDREAFQTSKQRENETIGKIERALPALLTADGHAAGRNSIEKAIRALRAAAVHPEGRALLENGHLTIDFMATGFDALGTDLVDSLQLPPPTERAHLRVVTGPSDADRNRAIEAKRALEAEKAAKAEAIEAKREAERAAREAAQKALLEEKQRLEAEKKALEEERRRAAEEKRQEAERRRAEADQRVKAAVEEQKRAAAEREQQILDQARQAARLGEAAKILGSLRRERDRLEEQAQNLDAQVDRARQALDRAQVDADRARRELDQKTAQITKLEQLLGLFDDGEEED